MAQAIALRLDIAMGKAWIGLQYWDGLENAKRPSAAHFLGCQASNPDPNASGQQSHTRMERIGPYYWIGMDWIGMEQTFLFMAPGYHSQIGP